GGGGLGAWGERVELAAGCGADRRRADQRLRPWGVGGRVLQRRRRREPVGDRRGWPRAGGRERGRRDDAGGAGGGGEQRAERGDCARAAGDEPVGAGERGVPDDGAGRAAAWGELRVCVRAGHVRDEQRAAELAECLSMTRPCKFARACWVAEPGGVRKIYEIDAAMSRETHKIRI